MKALDIYKKLSQPPKEALRPIQAGDLKGKTDINPQWRYKAMTETFGLVGIGWKYEIKRLWTEPGAKNETLAFAEVAVFIRDTDTKEWSDPIVGIGGSKLVNSYSSGLKSNDEGFKMAVTDAFSTSLKMIGVAADIYAGKWDGSKYANEPEPAAGTTTTSPAEKTETKKAAELPGGPDTQEQAQKIKSFMNAVDQNNNPYFSPEEKKKYSKMRLGKTANELINMLSKEIDRRKAEAKSATDDELPPDAPLY